MTRNPHGHIRFHAGQDREADTVSCVHCGGHSLVTVGVSPQDEAGWCHSCFGVVCRVCCSKPCTPFMKAIERSEERDRRRRSMSVEL